MAFWRRDREDRFIRGGVDCWVRALRPALVVGSPTRYRYLMSAETTHEIKERFDANIGRVRALIASQGHVPNGAYGHPPAIRADIREEMLRAAVVLLHAALEDLLRSIEEQWWPTASADAYEAIRFTAPGGDARSKKDKFTLKDLASWRSRSVDDVFSVAIEAHLAQSNYNNVADVKAILNRTGLQAGWVDQDGGPLSSLMTRRHRIAHRADRNFAGRGHASEPIAHGTVVAWADVVEAFGRRVLAELGGGKP